MTKPTKAAGSRVVVRPKPEHVNALRKTWRRTREHYQAQARRFALIFGSILSTEIAGNFLAGKALLPHFTSWRELQLYLGPLLYVAWRQFRPQLGAAGIDSAPGATIVPAEVAADGEGE